jgi:drug/metabolite transporter (DMT)-like permease
MWLFLRFKGQGLGLPPGAWGSIVLLALLNNALPFALFGWGQTHIASGLASILNATTPIWGVLVAHLFTRDERMNPRKIAGVLLGFGGVATMIGPTLLADVGNDALAQLACISASLSYAIAAVWARRFRRMGLSPLSVTTGQLSAGALMMLPMAMIVDQPWTQPLPPLSAWAAIAALAVMCTALGYVLYFRLIDSAGATNALLVTLLVPPFAILFGGLFLDEVLAPQDFIGLALIALGLAAIDGRVLRLLRPAKPATSPR